MPCNPTFLDVFWSSANFEYFSSRSNQTEKLCLGPLTLQGTLGNCPVTHMANPVLLTLFDGAHSASNSPPRQRAILVKWKQVWLIPCYGKPHSCSICVGTDALWQQAVYPTHWVVCFFKHTKHTWTCPLQLRIISKSINEKKVGSITSSEPFYKEIVLTCALNTPNLEWTIVSLYSEKIKSSSSPHLATMIMSDYRVVAKGNT